MMGGNKKPWLLSMDLQMQPTVTNKDKRDNMK